MPAIADRLHDTRARIAAACRAAGRAADGVRLVAISKTVEPQRISEALAAGQAEFGESYLQEALPKIAALPRRRITWHFVGPVQGNKAAGIAEQFDWVHGLDREKIARRLSDQRPPGMPPLNVCVQVNISGESTKGGVAPGEALALCRIVAGLPRLKLRGLMAIPAPLDTPAEAGYSGRTEPEPFVPSSAEGAYRGTGRIPFRRLRELFEGLRREGLELDTLSAGMSGDFEAAIAEGATLVRIGTAIFGPRPTP